VGVSCAAGVVFDLGSEVPEVIFRELVRVKFFCLHDATLTIELMTVKPKLGR
jgi:hypothetical protein